MSNRLTGLSQRTIRLVAAIALVSVALPTADNAWGGERTPRGSMPSVPAAARPLTSILGVPRRPQSAVISALHCTSNSCASRIAPFIWVGSARG